MQGNRYVKRFISTMMLGSMAACMSTGLQANSAFELWYESEVTFRGPNIPDRSETYAIVKTGKVPALIISHSLLDIQNQLKRTDAFINHGVDRTQTRSILENMNTGPDTEQEEIDGEVEFYKQHVVASTRRTGSLNGSSPVSQIVAVPFDAGPEKTFGPGRNATTTGNTLYFTSYNVDPLLFLNRGEPYSWDGATSQEIATLVSAPASARHDGAADADDFVQMIGNRVLFTAYDYRLTADTSARVNFVSVSNGAGRELFIHDGDTGETRLVKDIAPGQYDGLFDAAGGFNERITRPAYPGSSNPENLTRVVANCGVRVFFTADDGQRGRELWVTDGTENGTFMVVELSPGVRSTEFGQLFSYDGALVFTVKVGVDHWQIWRSDGSATGTTLVADFPYSEDAPDQFTVYGENLFFTADDLSAGVELWASDGTSTGTRRVTDINQGTGNANLSDPLVLDDTLYFSAFDNDNGCQLWKSDGTQNGTERVSGQPSHDTVHRDSSRCLNLAELDGRIYFEFRSSIWRYTPPTVGNSPISSITTNGSALICNVAPESEQVRDIDTIVERRLACLTNRQAHRESGRDRSYSQTCLEWAATRAGDNTNHSRLLVDWFSNATQANSLELAQRYTETQRLVLAKRTACISNREMRRLGGDNRSYSKTCWQWAADRIPGIDRNDSKRLLKQVKNTHPEAL